MLYKLKSIWREREERKIFEKNVFMEFQEKLNVFQSIKNCISILKYDKLFY